MRQLHALDQHLSAGAIEVRPGPLDRERSLDQPAPDLVARLTLQQDGDRTPRYAPLDRVLVPCPEEDVRESSLEHEVPVRRLRRELVLEVVHAAFSAYFDLRLARQSLHAVES